MEPEVAAEERETTLTVHSQTRMQQRGITERMIRIALEHGERYWSHGAVCYRITERSLCSTPFVSESDRLRGLCVVVARDGSIITVKWDYHFREPGPLRRRNVANWSKLRPLRSGELRSLEAEAMPLAA